MDSVWRLVVAKVAEPYLETEPFRLGSERTTKYMMPFKPLPGVADKALGTVLL
jgi:hypothetical protein